MATKSILGLRTVCYRVSDVTAAKKWYTNVFETEPYFDQPFYVGFTIGGYELGIQPEEKPSENKSESVLTYWGVQDVAREYKRFIAAGASPFEEPQDVGEGIVVAAVKDPWGNIIGLIHNPHFTLS